MIIATEILQITHFPQPQLIEQEVRASLELSRWLSGKDGEGNGTPLQYSCLENPMAGGAWKAAVHGVAEGRTPLSDFSFTFHFHALEKEMATHSSVLAWRIPGSAKPGVLPSMGSHSWTWLKWLSSSRGSGKESACQSKRHKRPGFYFWVRKIVWSRKCNPLQCSCLENSVHRGIWQATAHGSQRVKYDWVTERARARTHTHTRAGFV